MGDPIEYHLFTIQVEDMSAIEIRDRLMEFDGKRSIFDLDRLICYNQIRLALTRTERAFQMGTAIANTWGIEVLLHLYGNHQIVNCIEALGITKDTECIGIIQQDTQIPEGATNGIQIPDLDSNKSERLRELYQLPGEDNICNEILTKGISVVINHE